jgi:predicted lipoprotein with Yx(FWY)xxD motif
MGEARMSRTRLVWVMVAVGLALGLAGCGDDDGDTATTDETTATTRPAAVTTTAAPAATTTTAASTTAALVKTADHATLGKIVVDGGGYTLYTFDNDTGSTSSCTGGCAGTWPPVLVPEGTATPIPAEGVTGALASSPRPDGGGNQLTLDGKPLYRYATDAAPGDANGEGRGGVWHVVKVS